ncbi:hypothetical protein B0H13DRAFT_2016213 [Mycena leptocephala]|nr:hypothetical protein B0H13DRAFT_2016213 [Mycena leptocephala]
MSLSPHIKRQTRVVRRISPLTNICEKQAQMDPAPTLELIQRSVKAKRRQGVSDLRILPLFFSLSRDSADWRFTHCDSDSGEDEEVLEFPRPPTSALDVRTVCSRYSHSPHSSVDSIVSDPTSSGPPTTPTTPTYSTQTQTQMQKPCLVRCKTVRPQSTTNRSAAAPPSSSAPALASSTTLYQAIPEEADAAEYYAAHASAAVALAPPLPLPLPLSHSAATSSVSASAAPAAESASLSTASLAGTCTASVDPSTTQRESGILASSRMAGVANISTSYPHRVPRRPSRAPPPPPPPTVESSSPSVFAPSTACSTLNPALDSHSPSQMGSSPSYSQSPHSSHFNSMSADVFHLRNSHVHANSHSHSRLTSDARSFNPVEASTSRPRSTSTSSSASSASQSHSRNSPSAPSPRAALFHLRGPQTQVPNFSRPTSSALALRPAPSIAGLDARWSSTAGFAEWDGEGDLAADYAAYAPLLQTPTPSPVAATWHPGSGSVGAEAFGMYGGLAVLRDGGGGGDVSVSAEAGEDRLEAQWVLYADGEPEGCARTLEEDAPSSPLVASAPCPSLSERTDSEHSEQWHRRPSNESLSASTSSCASSVPCASVPSSASSYTPSLSSLRQDSPSHLAGNHQVTPVLGSRWSSSTVSTLSAHSAHTHTREKSLFVWRGRGKATSSPAAAYTAGQAPRAQPPPKPMPRPMGSVTVLRPPSKARHAQDENAPRASMSSSLSGYS